MGEGKQTRVTNETCIVGCSSATRDLHHSKGFVFPACGRGANINIRVSETSLPSLIPLAYGKTHLIPIVVIATVPIRPTLPRHPIPTRSAEILPEALLPPSLLPRLCRSNRCRSAAPLRAAVLELLGCRRGWGHGAARGWWGGGRMRRASRRGGCRRRRVRRGMEGDRVGGMLLYDKRAA